MKISKIIVPLAVMLIYACTNNVEKIRKKIDTNFDNKLSSDLKSVVATMEFKHYAVPENFWYPDGTTTKEIINDNLKTGYKNLGQLDDLISAIQTDNSDINSAVLTLHNRIIQARKDIKKAQEALDQVNSVFGFGLLGGANTLYDFANLFGSNSKNEDESNQMPKEVKEAFDNLDETIYQFYRLFLNKIYEFEIGEIGNTKISDAEISEVRLYIEHVVKSKTRQYYSGYDTVAINGACSSLMNYYNELFPVENIFVPEADGISSLIKNGNFILPTNTFIVSQKLQKEASIVPIENHGDSYKWKLDNGLVISTIPSSDGSINYAAINCENATVVSGLPYGLISNKTTIEECQNKFKENNPQKLPIYRDGIQNGFWLKFKKDKYWVYLSFNESSLLFEILVATGEIDQVS